MFDYAKSLSISTICFFLQVQTNAYTVIFDERFSIPLDLASLDECSLRFAAFGIDAEERNISAGVADLKLSDLDLTIRPFNAWLYLQDVNKVNFNTVACNVPQLEMVQCNVEIILCYKFSQNFSV